MLYAISKSCLHRRRDVSPIFTQFKDIKFAKIFRFKETVEVMNGFNFKIHITIEPQLVSSQTTYPSYLVYKLPRDQSIYEAPIEVMDEELSEATWYIYLVTPQFPVIRTNAYQYTRTLRIKKAFQNIGTTVGWKYKFMNSKPILPPT